MGLWFEIILKIYKIFILTAFSQTVITVAQSAHNVSLYNFWTRFTIILNILGYTDHKDLLYHCPAISNFHLNRTKWMRDIRWNEVLLHNFAAKEDSSLSAFFPNDVKRLQHLATIFSAGHYQRPLDISWKVNTNCIFGTALRTD